MEPTQIIEPASAAPRHTDFLSIGLLSIVLMTDCIELGKSRRPLQNDANARSCQFSQQQ
jgi:hypothetical protein